MEYRYGRVILFVVCMANAFLNIPFVPFHNPMYDYCLMNAIWEVWLDRSSIGIVSADRLCLHSHSICRNSESCRVIRRNTIRIQFESCLGRTILFAMLCWYYVFSSIKSEPNKWINTVWSGTFELSPNVEDHYQWASYNKLICWRKMPQDKFKSSSIHNPTNYPIVSQSPLIAMNPLF